MRFRWRQPSIITYVQALFIFLMSVAMSIMGWIVFSSWKLSVDHAIATLQEDIHNNIERELEYYLSVSMQVNRFNSVLIERNVVDVYNVSQRERYFSSVLSVLADDVYSFSYGTEQGGYYGTRRNEDNQLEIMRSDESTGRVSQYYAVGNDFTAGALTKSWGAFDPRQREWYKTAKNRGVPSFSPLYKHFILNDLTLSAAYPVYESPGVLKGVLGTHIMLAKVSSLLEKMGTEEKASAYIMERETGYLVASSLQQKHLVEDGKGNFRRVTLVDLGEVEVMRFYESYLATEKNQSLTETAQDVLHWKITSYQKDGLDWLIITVVPESSHISDLKSSLGQSLLISFFALALACALCRQVLTKLLAPISSLVDITGEFAQGNLEKRAVVGRKDEIGKLADAFNQMADELCALIQKLEQKVAERTSALEESNRALQEAKEKLEVVSQSDFLTNLYNRRFIQAQIEREVERFHRKGQSFSVIIGDIDYFKQVNDQYGHDCGDMALKRVGQLMKDLVRKTDFVSRWGGEEFLLLLPDTRGECAESVAEKIRVRLAETMLTCGDKKFSVTISQGVTSYRKEMSIDECISQADAALYEAKKNGRNKVVRM